MGRILAIDYGTRKTGIAVTDPQQIIASPLDTVPTHELMHFLEAYFAMEKVELMVVGYPRKPDHTDSEIAKLVRYFVDAFRKRFSDIPVEWMDERYTSRMAEDALLEGGMKRSGRMEKERVDRVSASLILQTYMERRNNLS